MVKLTTGFAIPIIFCIQCVGTHRNGGNYVREDTDNGDVA